MGWLEFWVRFAPGERGISALWKLCQQMVHLDAPERGGLVLERLPTNKSEETSNHSQTAVHAGDGLGYVHQCD